jgi:hypothetical protein
MKLADLPPVGHPLEAGIFAGLTTLPDGTHHAVVLLADKPDKPLTWKAAMTWAKKLEAQLPARPVSALMFATVKAQFEPEWHWTGEELDGAYAWLQFFYYGTQDLTRKSYEGRARAVRLIQLTP